MWQLSGWIGWKRGRLFVGLVLGFVVLADDWHPQRWASFGCGDSGCLVGNMDRL